MTLRAAIDLGGVPISYLTAGDNGPLVLLLHGTYWSRVWQPVLDDIAAAGLHPVAVDFPGFGRSGGELTVAEASVPQLAAWVVRFLDAMGNKGPVMVAGHDIGAGVAQHLLISRAVDVPRLALVNGVTDDSWPVPWGRPLPRSGRGGRDVNRGCSGCAPAVRYESARTPGKRSRDR